MIRFLVVIGFIVLTVYGIIYVGMPDAYNLDACLPSDNKCGFLTGLWHGYIELFSMIGSWFSDDIKIYDLNNNGFWYNCGFLIGTGALFKTGSSAVSTQGEA